MEAGPVINQGKKKLTSRIYNHKVTFSKWQYTEALGIINQNVFNQGQARGYGHITQQYLFFGCKTGGQHFQLEYL